MMKRLIIDITSSHFFSILVCITTIFNFGVMIWPVIVQFLPNSELESKNNFIVNLSKIAPGKCELLSWKGIPIFIKNRLIFEIRKARSTDFFALKDKLARNSNLASNAKAFDRNRCAGKKLENWLIMFASCTHLGCIPVERINQGWYCYCHNSHYDLAGRILSGPSVRNLIVPKYKIINNILIINE